jgi:hypothetical protein
MHAARFVFVFDVAIDFLAEMLVYIIFIEKQEATSIGVSLVSLFLGRPLLLAGEGRV